LDEIKENYLNRKGIKMQRKGSAFRKKELPIPFLQNPVARSSIPVCSDRLKGPDASHKKKKRKNPR
jgi:hypothetical protein